MKGSTIFLVGIMLAIVGGAWYYGNVYTKSVVSEANTTTYSPVVKGPSEVIPIVSPPTPLNTTMINIGPSQSATNTTMPPPTPIPTPPVVVPQVTNTTKVQIPTTTSPFQRNYNTPPTTPYIPYSPPVYNPPPSSTNTTLLHSVPPTISFPEFGSTKELDFTNGDFTFTDDRNLPGLTNPTEAQMKALLTTTNLPGHVSGQCQEYSLALRQAANSAGYRCAIVCLSLSTLENSQPVAPIHALNAFQTTDKSLIYIEPQDSSVRIIGKNLEYNPGKNLTDDFIKQVFVIW
jgi:hypothetical protein